MAIGPTQMWIGIGVFAAIFAATKLMQPSPSPLGPDMAAIHVGYGDDAKLALISRSECESKQQRLWVIAEGFGECIAYIASSTELSGSTAVIFFEGDFPDNATAKDEADTIASYQRRSRELSERFAVPVLVVARPGVMGSSGSHIKGGQRQEAAMMYATVDALRKKFSLRQLVLAGQSGGARVAAQLLVLGRTDISCAVLGSGAYDLPTLVGGGSVRTNIFGDAPKRYLVPMQAADDVARSSARRVYIIGDPRDTRTPFPQQNAWGEKLQSLGHHAVVLKANGSGPEHHGMSSVALQVAGQCAAGKTESEIRQWVETQNK
jgi:pimeloyl-ACP methyl ester carboxylesterase